MKTLKIFDSYIEAHLLKTKLESEAIYCFLQDENLVATDPLYSYAVGGIKLKVKKEDFEKAFKILEEKNTFSSLYAGKNICKNCGNTKFYDNYKSIKSLKAIVAMLFSFIFQTYPVYYKNVRKCTSCGHEKEIK